MKYFNQGYYTKAEKYFTDAKFFKPKSPKILAHLGISLYKQGKIGEAFNILTEAKNLGSGDFRTYYYLGRIYYLRGDLDNAIKEFSHSFNLNKKSFLTAGNLASALYHKKDYKGSLMWAEIATNLNSKDFESWNLLGLSYKKLGFYNKALEAYDKAIEINPNYCKAYNNKADLLLKMKNFKEAEDEIKEAISVGENNNDKRCLLYSYTTQGEIFEAQRKMKEALKSYETASNFFSSLWQDQEINQFLKNKVNELKKYQK